MQHVSGSSLHLYPLLPFQQGESPEKIKERDAVEIGRFSRLKISRLAPYQDLLRIGKSRKDAIFFDVGSCCKSHSNTYISPKMTSSS